MGASFTRMQWLFPITLALHNLEECIWMPAFWRERGIHTWVTAEEFRGVAAVLTLSGFLVTYWSGKSGRRSASTYIFAGFVFVMLLNAFWHAGASLWYRAYAPGMATGLLLNLPLAFCLLRKALKEEFIRLPWGSREEIDRSS